MKKHIFFAKSREPLHCPHGMNPLHHRDWKLRIQKKDGGKKEFIQADDLEDESNPTETTMKRWQHWLMTNRLYINGKLKSDGCRRLGFSEALRLSEVSLLDELHLIRQEWLETILRFIYKLGGFLVPV